MQYFSKHINRIYLIDVFSEQERQDQLFQVTEQLKECLLKLKVEVIVFYPITSAEVLQILQQISQAPDLGQGIVIHLISHGDEQGVGFGCEGCYIRWGDIEPHLLNINNACQCGLIMNTTCMCFGHNIFQLARPGSLPFHAAVGSTTARSLQAWIHNREVYKKCLLGDYAKSWWITQNINISYYTRVKESYRYLIN